MYNKESFEAHAKIENSNPKVHEMMPQRGIKHTIFSPEVKYNAIWDYVISPEGKHYFSLCAEIAYPEFVRFYEYIPQTCELKHLWSMKDKLITYDRAIRPSKLHTSISFIADGRIIMATHTTAGAPNHPYWMPVAYYSHMWEGYSGSNLIIYDPKTCKVEDLGIPVPHESIYGGIYDEKSNAYYFSGSFRGHVYRFDLSNRHVTDYGQVSEYSSFRFVKGLDNNIYHSSKSGRLYRINTDTKEVEDLNIQFPISNKYPTSKSHNQMIHAIDGPDGKLYMYAAYNDMLLAYNYQTNSIEVVGNFAAEEFSREDMMVTIDGLAFDKFGVLWYGTRVSSFTRSELNSVWLASWDFLNGKKPKNMGIAGTPGRSVAIICDMYIKNDILYCGDTNHGSNPPAILEVDLAALREDKDKERVICKDPIHYFPFKDGLEVYGEDLIKDSEALYALSDKNERDIDFVSENPFVFQTPKAIVTKLWKYIPVEQSRVNKVWFDEEGYVHAICGMDVFTHFVVKKGEIISKENDYNYIPEDKDELIKEFSHMKLPAHPGRNYLAVANVAVDLKDGRKLVGTKDGLLAIVSEKGVFSLGPCAPNGPVHGMAVSSDKSKAYGVAGDKSDLGMVFTYDDEKGLIMHGRIFVFEGMGTSCEPYCIAISPDDKKLAIGVVDRLGCVYEFNLE